MSAENDKQTERTRYDREARRLLSGEKADLSPDGAESIPITLRAPYREYERLIERNVQPGVRVLDVCCGTGLYSVLPARLGGMVTATDIAPTNLEIVKRRAERAGVFIATEIADAEQLPFENQVFDVVMIANSLSYMDLVRFMGEVERVLRPAGSFIFVDSYNRNPVYRFNRYIRYLRQDRTLSTLQRMPSKKTLEILAQRLVHFQVSYFGILSFLSPVLVRIFGSQRAAHWIDDFDQRASPRLQQMAFKIVGSGNLRPHTRP